MSASIVGEGHLYPYASPEVPQEPQLEILLAMNSFPWTI